LFSSCNNPIANYSNSPATTRVVLLKNATVTKIIIPQTARLGQHCEGGEKKKERKKDRERERWETVCQGNHNYY
jgi:hypothetical protein